MRLDWHGVEWESLCRLLKLVEYSFLSAIMAFTNQRNASKFFINLLPLALCFVSALAYPANFSNDFNSIEKRVLNLTLPSLQEARQHIKKWAARLHRRGLKNVTGSVAIR